MEAIWDNVVYVRESKGYLLGVYYYMSNINKSFFITYYLIFILYAFFISIFL